MRSLAALATKLDDWCNPIAVKELRQAVQSNAVAGLLTLFLVGQLAVMLTLVLGRSADELSFDLGRKAFVALYGILVMVCALLVPAYCARRLMAERTGAHVDLLFITALRPRTIVWGKLCSGLVISALIFSACMPFLVFTYWLRGIDIPSILLFLVTGFLASAIAIQLAVLFGCVRASRPARAILGLLGAIVAVYLAGGVMSSTFGLLAFGVGGSVLSGRFWAIFVPALLLVLMALGHFFVWSVAILSPRSSNRALPMRLFSSIAWLVTGIACAISTVIDPYGILLGVWAFLSTSVFCLGLFTAVCEREKPGHRVAQAIPRNGWRRALAFLFYSGAGGGVAWACVMIALTMVTFAAASPLDPTARGYALGVIAAMGAGAFASAMTALFIRKKVVPGYRPAYTWMMAASLSLLSLFILAGIEPSAYLALVLIWAMAAGFAGLPWFVGQAEGFRPDERPDSPAPAAAGDPPVARAVARQRCKRVVTPRTR